jgi:hypothetical protein
MQYGIDCVGLDAVRLHNEVFPAISGGEYSYISLTADSREFRLQILDAVARSTSR